MSASKDKTAVPVTKSQLALEAYLEGDDTEETVTDDEYWWLPVSPEIVTKVLDDNKSALVESVIVMVLVAPEDGVACPICRVVKSAMSSGAVFPAPLSAGTLLISIPLDEMFTCGESCPKAGFVRVNATE